MKIISLIKAPDARSMNPTYFSPWLVRTHVHFNITCYAPVYLPRSPSPSSENERARTHSVTPQKHTGSSARTVMTVISVPHLLGACDNNKKNENKGTCSLRLVPDHRRNCTHGKRGKLRKLPVCVRVCVNLGLCFLIQICLGLRNIHYKHTDSTGTSKTNISQ